MAYTITLTDGTVFATIADGSVNQSSSVTLIGKNYAGYGAFQDENFIQSLENFSSDSSAGNPTSSKLAAPLRGQIWWDKTNSLLKVYNGSVWKTISAATAAASAPTNNVTGDLWFDTVNQQLKVWTGSTFLVVGPAYSAAQGTSGAIPETITDSGGATKYITSLYVNNARVGIVYNGSSFTPQVSLQATYPTIYPGITLTTANSSIFAGTANNANYLNSLTSSQFMRSDANTSTTGRLQVNNNNGLYVGTSNVLNISQNSNDANLYAAVSGGNLIMSANVGGSPVVSAQVLGSNGTFAISNAATVGTTVSAGGNVTGGNLRTGGQVSASGNITGGNIITGGAVSTAGTVSASGNITGGNITTAGIVSASGNIDSAANISAAIFLGDGGYLSNVSSAVSVKKIEWGNSNVSISGSDGNATVSIAGTSNVAVFTTSGLTVANVTTGNVFKSGSNVVGNVGSSTNYFNQMFAATYNGVVVSASGNVTGGNIITGGALSAAGNVSATGNVLGGNVITGGLVNSALVSATGNITGGNVLTGGSISAASVSASGNILATGAISASGNVTGNYILGNGSQLTGISTSASRIFNGTSEANIGTLNGNANITIGGSSNVAVFTTSGVQIQGLVSATGNVTGGNVNTSGIVSVLGDVVSARLLVSGNIVSTAANATANIGNATNYFNVVHARATSAQYADMAERFESDEYLEPGTVVELGGVKEITRSRVELSDRIFGVISTRPAYLMNGGAGDDSTHPPVAMTGRVPVKVLGSIRKGDRLVSAGNGFARAAVGGEITAFNVLGRALQDKHNTEPGEIEAIVTIK